MTVPSTREPTTGPALVEVRVSVPDSEAARAIAEDLVARRLAACVQVLGPMASIYAWQDEVHRSQEWLLLVKTTCSSFAEVARVVTGRHPYDVPEIVATPITHALAEYAAWVRKGSLGLGDGAPAGA